jgi:hypothetical protein
MCPNPCSLAATNRISSISFPLATEMFHFARFAPRRVIYITAYWVAPFGNPWIKVS